MPFPDPNGAPADGLVAIGGGLAPERLMDAYAHGIFPWFNDDRQPVLWWSPDPRAVVEPKGLHVSRRLARRLRRREFVVTLDAAFADVVRGCAAPHRGRSETWITPRMQTAYGRLHDAGFAHSVDVWRDGDLVGGLYGISIGRMFFGESMFSAATDASKVALATLARVLHRWRFTLIDCQVMNDHLRSLGVSRMSRRRFLSLVAANNAYPTRRGRWVLDETLADDAEVTRGTRVQAG